ncbi:hypothetical protein FRC11_001124, partial [Ceratobasidium sp. 423]
VLRPPVDFSCLKLRPVVLTNCVGSWALLAHLPQTDPPSFHDYGAFRNARAREQ